MFDNIRADFRAHGRQWSSQGFWAMAVYRFGRWRYGVRPVWLRKILSALYKVSFKFIQIITGIELPVDGGRMRADCRVEKDLIVWKPLDLPDPTFVRWMNQSDDPVVRYVMDGETITITQTLPDGTTEQAELAVPAEEEAR